MVEIETFNLNEDLLVDYDYNSLDDLKLGSFEDIKAVFGLVSTFNTPFGSETLQPWTFFAHDCKLLAMNHQRKNLWFKVLF